MPDVELEEFVPADPADVCLNITACIGPKARQGEDLFSFGVCTPRALERLVASAERGYLLGRHYIIVHRYSYEVIRRAIEDLCREAQGPDWETVAGWLARYGSWEFEDYRQAPLPSRQD